MTTQWKQSKGLTIIYVGDGKGKTTAAVGAAVRVLGHGWGVLFMQFMKEEKWPSGERDLFRAVFALSAEALAKEDYVLPGVRGPAAVHPAPTASSSGLLGLERGPRSASPLRESKDTPSVLGEIKVEVVGEGFVGIMGDKKERETHQNAALAGLARASEQLASGKYPLVILDEILSAVDEGLLSEQQILDLMGKKPEDVTLIMTGHKHYPNIFAKADLVTEMKKLKHPFDNGFIAKKGIDY
ncbi:MAG: cob(I)yrinic acid a,c-diamide adenosyltransferase [bacterium]|nr:cob(I)yrinic acid a,c-diamide adenosyltransferase [bacterium]